MVSTTTAAQATPTATHCTGRSCSFRISTPMAMVTSGLMKYPSEASTTWPEFTDQMYRPQLTVMTPAATATRPSFRGCRSSSPAQAQRRTTIRAAATKTSDQAIRWARISTAPAGSSSGQNSGTRPHMP